MVEAELAARQRQDDRVFRGLLHELRVVVTPELSAVATAHEEDVFERTGLDRIDHLVGNTQDRVMAETGQQRLAVDLLLPAAQLDRMGDHGGEVLLAACIRADVRDARPADFRRGIKVADVGGLGRHDAVRCVEHNAGQAVELLLLVLPSGAEIAFQLRVFLEFGISVRGQHLAMRIHVDSFSFGLLQQHLEVVQVVSGNDDKGTLVALGGNRRRDRVTVSSGVGGVEQPHALQVDRAELHDQAEPGFYAMVIAEGLHALLEPARDLSVGLAQYAGVGGVGGHAAQAEEQGGTQRDDIRVAME